MRAILCLSVLAAIALAGPNPAPPTPGNGGGGGGNPPAPPTPGGGSGPAPSGGDEEATTDGGTLRLIGGSGWIEYCPSFPIGGEATPRCMRIRPFGFAETDANGQAVPITGSTGRQRRINNLYSTMTVGRVVTQYMPHEALCSAFEEKACGWLDSDNTAGMPYLSIPITLDLSDIAGPGAHMNITTYLFRANGTLAWDSMRLPVRAGMAKFDVDISGYTFAETGTKINFEMRLDSQSTPTLDRNATSGASNVDGMLLNFPRFATKGNATASAWSWQTVDVGVAAAGGLTYSFAGPFASLSYDPIMGDAGTAVAPDTTPLPGLPAPTPSPGTNGGAPADSGSKFPVVYVAIAAGVVVVLLVVVGVVVMMRNSKKKADDQALLQEYVAMQ